MAEAAAAGAIHLEPFSADELAAQHADHVTRKIENPARVRALGLEGEPEPVYGNFRTERMVALAGPQRDAQA